MRWNHRLVHMTQNQNVEPWVKVMETHYNHDGTIAGFSEPCLGSEYPDQIADVLRQMLNDIVRNPDVVGVDDAVGFKPNPDEHEVF